MYYTSMFIIFYHSLSAPKQYTVSFYTSDVKNGGSDATIHVTLSGSNGSKEFRLRNCSSNHAKAFQPGQ